MLLLLASTAAVAADVQDVVRQVQQDNATTDFLEEAQRLADTVRARDLPAPEGTLPTDGSIDLGDMISRQGKGALQPTSPKLEKLLVFVSFSVPETSLRQLAQQVSAAGGVLVLRGFVNNSIKETLPALTKLAESGARVMLDPTLFRDYRVEVVPTFVVSTGHVPPCTDRDCDRQLPAHDRVSGDVSLSYALEAIEQGRGPGATVAKVYGQKLKEATR